MLWSFSVLCCGAAGFVVGALAGVVFVEAILHFFPRSRLSQSGMEGVLWLIIAFSGLCAGFMLGAVVF
jgi:hypothetical protein